MSSKRKKVHPGVPGGGGAAGDRDGPAGGARGRRDRRRCAVAGSVGAAVETGRPQPLIGPWTSTSGPSWSGFGKKMPIYVWIGRS